MDTYLAAQVLGSVPGLTYRQLQHWTRIGLIQRTNDKQGPGHNNTWSADEVKILRLTARLVGAGVLPARAVRTARVVCADTGGEHVEVRLGLGVYLLVDPRTLEPPAVRVDAEQFEVPPDLAEQIQRAIGDPDSRVRAGRPERHPVTQSGVEQ